MNLRDLLKQRPWSDLFPDGLYDVQAGKFHKEALQVVEARVFTDGPHDAASITVMLNDGSYFCALAIDSCCSGMWDGFYESIVCGSQRRSQEHVRAEAARYGHKI